MGAALVIVLCAIAALLALPAVSQTNVGTTISLAASSTAFVAMAISQFLATRPPFAENLFGGLDRIYQLHRKIGIAILVLILIHYFVTPDFKGLALTSGLNDLARTVGEFAFYAFIAIIVVSVIKRVPRWKFLPVINFEIPYQFWRYGHRLVGIFFVLIAFHQMFIKRPFDGTALLAVYLNIFAFIGIASYLYTQFGANFRTRAYTVDKVEKHEGATIISAKPDGRPIKPMPGQFGFFRVNKSQLGEPHPFTIAGIEDDGSVKFCIKPLGDYTAKLREKIEVGDRLKLEGGYGKFNFRRGGPKQIWLAGGIGITPFLAMASRLTGDEPHRIHLVYCVRNRAEAIGLDVFESKAATLENFSFKLFDSEVDGRLDAKKLAELSPVDPGEADLWFCGPPPLRVAIEKGLKDLGKAPKAVEFERFEFR